MPLPIINVPNAAGISTPVNTPNAGRQADTDSAAVVLSTQDKAALDLLVAAAQLATAAAIANDTSVIYNNGIALTPKFAKIAVSASGVNNLVALVAAKKIRVLAFTLVSNGAVNAKFQSHVTPTDISGLIYMPAAGNGVSCNFNPVGWFETIAGEALDINLSGAVAVGGMLTYVEV